MTIDTFSFTVLLWVKLKFSLAIYPSVNQNRCFYSLQTVVYETLTTKLLSSFDWIPFIPAIESHDSLQFVPSNDTDVVEAVFLGELISSGHDSHVRVHLPCGLVVLHLLLQLDFFLLKLVHLRDHEEAFALEEAIEDLFLLGVTLFVDHFFVFDLHDFHLVVVHHQVLSFHSQ